MPRISGGVLALFAAIAVLSIAALAMKAPATSPFKAELPGDQEALESLRLLIPVKGVDRKALRDNFDEYRGRNRHEALDIMAPRGTLVLAAGDGRVVKLFNSVPGGLTVYQFDRDEQFAFYYAHLDRYAEGLKEGTTLKRGDVLGYVGNTGNAPPNAPHLHFTIFKLGPDKRWWKGTAINPYPYLTRTR